MKRILLVAALILVAGTCWAHLPVGVLYPAVQFPDGKVPVIDGNVVEWDIIPEPYWLTQEQLTETVKGLGTGWDATDMALRAIVGWNPTANKLFIMEDRFDDAIYVLTKFDCMEMEFDADHSAEMFGMFPDVEDQEQKDRLHGAHAQNYGINNGGPGIFAWHKSTWHDKPPWGNLATTQTVSEGGEGFFRAEYMLTGFDDLDWHGPDFSTVHQLKEGEIVGFNFTIIDMDDPEIGYDGYWTLSGSTDSFWMGDALSDFLLAPVDPDIAWGEQATAVEDMSWGRLKSTFTE